MKTDDALTLRNHQKGTLSHFRSSFLFLLRKDFDPSLILSIISCALNSHEVYAHFLLNLTSTCLIVYLVTYRRLINS
ncbi:hypothetical protein Zmor_006490 [Zophobas morio]|uniref:Uncharacterized protein n=1 Tax=Zophobas morio TaxID=2755281 RepID=A0AA38IUZ7_9CUCU|nr:hypothetical protein Zmor_006490 [Zophobas morio]